MLFLSADIIAPILTKFYNVSVETETVISDWKLSKVPPIYKGKGSKDEAGNYLLNNTTLCANWSLPWVVLRS